MGAETPALRGGRMLTGAVECGRWPRGYLLAFLLHSFVVTCHWPPAPSHSACVLNCDRSVDIPPPVEGLAEGLAEGALLGESEVEVPGLLEPLLGLLLSELPGA